MSTAAPRPTTGEAASSAGDEPYAAPHAVRGPRALARQAALEVCFEADVRDAPVARGLEQRAWLGEAVDPYARELIEGVSARRDELDARISAVAENWAIDRMPVVDRNILRIAVYELFVHPEVPTAVVLSEAVRLATLLSTDRSGSFVNGVLARILRELQGRELQGRELPDGELPDGDLPDGDLPAGEAEVATSHGAELGDPEDAARVADESGES